MISEIKNLELLGQSTSLKQHRNVTEMLVAMGFDSDSFENIHSKEYVCMLAPDDDNDDSDDGESE